MGVQLLHAGGWQGLGRDTGGSARARLELTLSRAHGEGRQSWEHPRVGTQHPASHSPHHMRPPETPPRTGLILLGLTDPPQTGINPTEGWGPAGIIPSGFPPPRPLCAALGCSTEPPLCNIPPHAESPPPLRAPAPSPTRPGTGRSPPRPYRAARVPFPRPRAPGARSAFPVSGWPPRSDEEMRRRHTRPPDTSPRRMWLPAR